MERWLTGNWKVVSQHDNIVLGENLTRFDARLLALEWAAYSPQMNLGLVPGFVVTENLYTLIWREESTFCRRNRTHLHLELPCRCEEEA